MKYYVYTASQSDRLIFVTDLDKFAKDLYNPQTMEFTGVVIEADSAIAAKLVYESPGDDNKVLGKTSIAWIEEPVQTAEIKKYFTNQTTKKLKILKEAVEKSQEAAFGLHAAILTQQIADALKKLNKDMCILASLVRKSSGNSPEITEQELSNRLKQSYVQQLNALPFFK